MADATAPLSGSEVAPRGRALRAFLRHRGATIALVILTVMTASALLAPWIAPFDPEKIDILRSLADPSARNWLGTDEVGRDVFSRLLFGGRVSIVVGLVAATLSVAIGVAIGGLSAYFGGLLDGLLMRFTEACSRSHCSSSCWW